MSVWKGAVFELHAVLSGTEELHFEAWKRTFDNVLGELDHGVRREFAYEHDYLPHLYGRPRYAGVADFFRSRDIHLTHGHPTDAPGKRTVCGIANRKNELFRVLLAERGVPSMLNESRTVSFFGDDIEADRLGIDSKYAVNITLRDTPSDASESTVLCADEAPESIGDCNSGDGSPLAVGPETRSSDRSVTTARTGVFTDRTDAVLEVRVWSHG